MTPNQFGDIAAAFHAEGIQVYAWGYCYGFKPELEASRAIEALKQGADGYVLNAETQFKAPGMDRVATTLCAAIRSYLDAQPPPRKLFAFSSFGWVGYHREFLFEVFGAYCDAAMPQVYWSIAGVAPRTALSTAYANWCALEADWRSGGKSGCVKPIISVGSAHGGRIRQHEAVAETSPEEMVTFAAAAEGYGGVSWWVWDVMDDAHWRVVRKVAANRK
ncbi:MAG: hypothetical protein ACOYBJ_01845 [Patescibacteria group bacterium]|jgi:hypothetical protein